MATLDVMLNCSDEELLTRCRKGRWDAFDVLVRRYERELFGYLRRYVGDSSLAEDVFQNTFLQCLFTKIKSYEPRSARASVVIHHRHPPGDRRHAPQWPASGGQPASNS